MKTYHGIRLSHILGDVRVNVRQLWGFCAKCQENVPEGTAGSFEHFDASYSMCDATMVRPREHEEELVNRATREPSDFEWGARDRAGSMNLALSILWDLLGEQPNYGTARSFSNQVIAHLDRSEWSLDEQDVRRWMRGYMWRDRIVA